MHWKKSIRKVFTIYDSNSYFIKAMESVYLRHALRDKLKSSRPSLRETRDNRPLGRYPDRSWCYRQNSVKLSWSKPMDPWIVHSYAAADVHGAMACDQKTFTLVWSWLQLLSGSLPKDSLSRVSRWLKARLELCTLASYVRTFAKLDIELSVDYVYA